MRDRVGMPAGAAHGAFRLALGQLALLRPALRNFHLDNGATIAAALAFLSLFSGFPLLLLAVLLSSFVVPPEVAASRVREMLLEYIPVGAALIETAIQGAVQHGVLAIGAWLVAFLWAGSRVLGLAARAVNDAWGVADAYSVRTRLLLDPFLALVAVALICGGLLSGPVLASVAGQPDVARGGSWGLAGWLGTKLVGLTIVAALYRYLPRTTAVRWRHALRGAILFMLLFQLSQEIFEWYHRTFSERYVEVYGALSAAAVLLLWAYITAAAFLLGAEYAGAHRLREERRPVRKAVATVPPGE